MNDELIIYGIFNANSSFMSEISYSVRKVLGQSDCNLCEISFGWNPFGKKDWKNAISASPIRIELIHRDEAELSQLNAASHLPTFIMTADGNWVELMNADTIATFKGRPADLVNALNHLIPTI
jgi:hypothetical protein